MTAGRGRPPVGTVAKTRLPADLDAALSDWVAREGVTRAAAIREAVRRLVGSSLASE